MCPQYVSLQQAGINELCLISLEHIPLQTLLPVITAVVPAKWYCHLWTRKSLLLTYLLTYLLSCITTCCALVSQPTWELRRQYVSLQQAGINELCLISLDVIPLQTLLPVITAVVPAKWYCHLWTRKSLLLTYLLTYSWRAFCFAGGNLTHRAAGCQLRCLLVTTDHQTSPLLAKWIAVDNPCTKFKMSSATGSRDRKGVTWSNHAPVRAIYIFIFFG